MHHRGLSSPTSMRPELATVAPAVNDLQVRATCPNVAKTPQPGCALKESKVKKTLILGKTEGRRRRGQQRMRRLDGITDSMDMSLSNLGDGEGQGSLVCCSPWGCKESDATERLNNNI